MINSKDDCIGSLCGAFMRTSRWRSSLQKKFPSDARNGRAAETLSRLADEAVNLTDEQWLALQPHFHWTSEKWADDLSQATRRVEFQRNVRTFPAFVQDLISVLSENSVAA
jgi:cyclopropane fatty-acyl-phospholipid synthase-like methyltransferase